MEYATIHSNLSASIQDKWLDSELLNHAEETKILCPAAKGGKGIVIPYEILSVRLSTTYSCLLCELKTVRDIMKFLTNVKHHETTYRTHKQ